MKKLFSYENGVVTLMAVTFGALFFDRLALNYLVPYVAADLSLNNFQIGLLAAGLSLAWAASSYFTTAWSERNDRNKLVFITAVIVFSVCSFGSGLAIGFMTLLIARIIMGIAEGPVIPLAQLFVERESSPGRLGLNVGILNAIGSALFGSILAPVILIQIAEDMSWRNAFYIAGIPGFVLALIAALYLKRSTTESRSKKMITEGVKAKQLLKYHNIKWGVLLACCVFGWWFSILPFITKYFTNAQGMSAPEMQKTMGLLGVIMLLFSLIYPGLSDKFGRKKIVLIALIIGVFFPASVYFLSGQSSQLPAMLLTYSMVGIIPLVAAVIPSQAVPNHLKAVAIGFVTAVGEVVGGVLMPAIAGALSDAIHESAFLWVATALAVLGIICALKLKKSEEFK